MTEFTVKLKCDMLVDQNRMIGNDPVGHACSNDAEWSLYADLKICGDCIKALAAESKNRVSFPEGFPSALRAAAIRASKKHINTPSETQRPQP